MRITTSWNQITSNKVINSHIEKLNHTIRLIKIENKDKNNNISSEDLQKIDELLKKAKTIDEKFPEIEKKMESFSKFEKETTKEQIDKIGTFYFKQAKLISKDTNNKNFFQWWNNRWIIVALVFWILILLVSWYNIYCVKNDVNLNFIATLPAIATLSIFLIFFLKQYSNNRNLINSYNFKWISANVMEYLLLTRETTDEWKIILEKTLDKILDDPTKNDKGWSETINLINTSLKTPWN